MDEAASLVLRAGTEEDWPALRALLKDCPEAAPWADTYPSVIFEADGEKVGFLLYRVIAGEGEILNLAVSPNWRRRGLAKRLSTAIAELAEEWYLEVRETNIAAIALYETLGFERVGRRERYYSDGEAALLFRFRHVVET